MKSFLLIASAAAFAVASPALAKPGHGNSGHGNWGHDGQRHGWSYDQRHCPPGLAMKHNGCMPPGQARRHYNIGQRYASEYGHRWDYSQIPYDMRQQYGLRQDYNYYYRDGYLYRVNPRTMLVQQVLSAILR